MIRPLEIPDIPGRLYAVGDIHGRKAEVEVLLAHLEQGEKLGKDDIVIFIGDYVDRGQESREVVDLLIRFKARHPHTIFLRGNHEDMLLGFLGFIVWARSPLQVTASTSRGALPNCGKRCSRRCRPSTWPFSKI